MMIKISLAVLVSIATASSAMAWQQPDRFQPSVFSQRSPFAQRQISPQQKSQTKVDQATQALKVAKTDDARATAEANLRDALASDYDLKMKGYEQTLEKMEKELEAMRERLSRRRAAKAEMVDLRIKVLKAEADDLGWPSDVTRSRNVFGSESSVGYYPERANLSQPVAPLVPLRTVPLPQADDRASDRQ